MKTFQDYIDDVRQRKPEAEKEMCSVSRLFLISTGNMLNDLASRIEELEEFKRKDGEFHRMAAELELLGMEEKLKNKPL